ncbi:hypothetical protein [Thermococcus sp.]
MASLSTVFRSKLFVSGFAFLVLAMVLSAVSITYTQSHSYSSSGTLGPGQHVLGNTTFEKSYSITNRTLVIKSENASLGVLYGTNYTQYNLTGRLILHPTDSPTIKVYRGNVTYTYNVTGISYPYSNLSLVALVFAVVGTVFAWVGFERAFRR